MSTRAHRAYFALSLTGANLADATSISEGKQADTMRKTWWEGALWQAGRVEDAQVYIRELRMDTGYCNPGTAIEQRELKTWITIWHDILFLDFPTGRYLYLLATAGVNKSLLTSTKHTRHIHQLAGLAF